MKFRYLNELLEWKLVLKEASGIHEYLNNSTCSIMKNRLILCVELGEARKQLPT